MHVQYADVSKAKQSSLSLRYPCRCPETENGIKRRHARENHNLLSWNCNECRLSRCGHSWRFDGGLLLKFCPGLNLIRAVVMGASFFFFGKKNQPLPVFTSRLAASIRSRPVNKGSHLFPLLPSFSRARRAGFHLLLLYIIKAWRYEQDIQIKSKGWHGKGFCVFFIERSMRCQVLQPTMDF